MLTEEFSLCGSTSVVVTGASGTLGAAILAECGVNERVSGWYLHGPPRRLLRRVDITDERAVRDAFDDLRPRLCIHCAAIADVERCESDPAQALDVNVRGTEILADAAKRYATRFVLISTDYVFDGRSATLYAEDAPPNPLQVYGETKQSAETIVLNQPGSVVVRLPLLYSANRAGRGWFAETWMRLAARAPVRADALHLRQPALVNDVAASICALIAEGVDGIVHVAPRQVMSRYQWAQLIADAVGASRDLVLPTSVPSVVPRPLLSPLATRRLETIGLEPPRSVETVLAEPGTG